MPPSVLTLTGNLLAEWTFLLPSFHQGHTHRAHQTLFQLGGKGINVARVLHHMGASAECLGFADGPFGAFCSQYLKDRQIPHQWFPLGKDVRPGFILRQTDQDSAPETTFLGTDQPVPADSWAAACRYAAQQAPDWFAICGSIPGWQPAFLEPLHQLRRDAPHTRIALDTYGPPLADLLRFPADLIKINRSEWESLPPSPAHLDSPHPPKPLSLEESLRCFAANSAVANWILTDGPHDILALWADHSAHCIQPANIPEVSPTGSGDTFLAALLHHWPAEPHQRSEALGFAAACASANAAQPSIADFPLPPPPRFFPRMG